MIELTAAALLQMMPRAPLTVINAFASREGMSWLVKAGITANRTRLATAFAHVGHECNDFTIANLTENINYTAERMAAVWPNRFKSAADIRAKYGAATGWQKKAFDDIYGGRMGNQPGTSDGSRYIGRGGPQVTGRDGYREVGKRCGLPLEDQPELACRPEHQPAILAAFWMWKGLSPLADKGGVETTVKPWNGGTNGLEDRRARYAKLKPIIAKLREVDDLPAAAAPPPTPAPTPQPVPEQQPASSLITIIVNALAALFRRK